MIKFIKKKESIFVLVVALIVTSIFFYKTILLHQIPFPGDLLVNLMPYKMQSFAGFVPGTYPNKAQDLDVITQLYPWKYFAISELKAGRIPFWNPHNFAGNPQMQDYQTGVFYPLNILFFIFSFPTAWSLYILSQPLFALIFMYLFLREEKIGLAGRLIGSIAFAFSSYIVVWVEYGNIASTWLWLPLVLFLIKKYLDTLQLRWFVLLVVSLTTAFFAGYIQGMFYIYLIAGIYSGWHVYQNKYRVLSKRISFLLLGLLLPLLLSSMQILPTLEVFKESTRENYSLSQIQFLLNPWYSFITLFSPDFFGNPVNRNMTVPLTYIERVMYPGLAVFFFAFAGILWSKRKEKWVWVICGGFVLLITTNIPGVSYLYQIPIPVLSTTVPTRALSIVLFCFAVLAAYGVDSWSVVKMKKKWLLPVIFLCVFGLLWMAAFLLPSFFPETKDILVVAKRNLLVPTGFLFATIVIFYGRIISPQLAKIALLILVIVDLCYFFQKITPFTPAAFIYPHTPVTSFLEQQKGFNRFWGYGEASIPPGLQSVDGTYFPDGIDALHLKTYGDLLAASKTGFIPKDVPRMEANVVPGYGVEDIRKNMYRQKLLNITGTKYILHRNTTTVADTDTFPKNRYQLLWQKDGLQVYENLSSLPRAFLSSHYQVISDEKRAINSFYNTSFHPEESIILSEKPTTSISPIAKGSVSLQTYTPQKIVLQAETTGPMLLFLSDAYTPDWYAQVDGKSTHVYLADSAFRAIVVPRGTHTIQFFYESKAFFTGLILSFIGLVGLSFCCIVLYKYGEKK
ncbi:MAG TPA: YfhO family protein [Candidatus Saccharimonadales bacterium]|nr:YfhO family protein [Candidatus Saccharimonadales bacterium]